MQVKLQDDSSRSAISVTEYQYLNGGVGLVLMSSGDKVVESRKRMGLNQRQFAKLVGVFAGHLSGIETGLRRATREMMQRIADAAHVDVDWLMEDEVEQQEEFLRRAFDGTISSSTRTSGRPREISSSRKSAAWWQSGVFSRKATDRNSGPATGRPGRRWSSSRPRMTGSTFSALSSSAG